MRDTQSKFMAAMQEIADHYDLDLVVNTNSANTGRIYFQPRNAFEPILEFPFNFQNGYCSFNSIVAGKQWPMVTYSRHDNHTPTLDHFVSVVRIQVEKALHGNPTNPPNPV